MEGIKIFNNFPNIIYRKFSLSAAVVVGALTATWIVCNSGLRLDPDGWLKTARRLATTGEVVIEALSRRY